MPRAPKKCGRLTCTARVTGRTYCPAHTVEQRDTSSWGRGSTRQSRKDRAAVLAAWPICHLAYEGCTIRSTEDDHVVPVSQGGSDDFTNRRGACTHCHRVKSQREAAQARGGRTPSPRH